MSTATQPELSMFMKLNDDREAHGLSPVNWSDALANAADATTFRDITNNTFEHSNPQDVVNYGYNLVSPWLSYENHQYELNSFLTPEGYTVRFTQGYADSPSHEQARLLPDARQAGESLKFIGPGQDFPSYFGYQQGAYDTEKLGGTAAEHSYVFGGVFTDAVTADDRYTTGEAVAGVQVDAVIKTSGAHLTATTDAAGYFELPVGDAAGDVDLTFHFQDLVTDVMHAHIDGNFNDRVMVELDQFHTGTPTPPTDGFYYAHGDPTEIPWPSEAAYHEFYASHPEYQLV